MIDICDEILGVLDRVPNGSEPQDLERISIKSGTL